MAEDVQRLVASIRVFDWDAEKRESNLLTTRSTFEM
jgi:hypothetical protein